MELLSSLNFILFFSDELGYIAPPNRKLVSKSNVFAALSQKFGQESHAHQSSKHQRLCLMLNWCSLTS